MCSSDLLNSDTRHRGKNQVGSLKLGRSKNNKEFRFEAWPEPEDTAPQDINVSRVKRFELEPMTVDEAVVQMEMLEHNFYIFLNMETDSVNVVYKRKENDYGLLETTY